MCLDKWGAVQVLSKKICVVGTFSGKLGRAVTKNNELTREMNNIGTKVIQIDFGKCINRGIGILNILIRLSRYKQILASLSVRQRWVLLPYFMLLILFKRHICLLVIGGAFGDQLMRMPFFVRALYVKMLNKLDLIVVETCALRKQLEGLGVKNAIRLPNFKRSVKYFVKNEQKRELEMVFFPCNRKQRGVRCNRSM